MSHERPVEPFSDLHVEDGRVRATLLHDPTVEGLDMAIYMDGSYSMKEEYEQKTRTTGTFWQRLFGGGTTEVLPNQVEPQVQVDARVPGHQGSQRHPARRLLGLRLGRHGGEIIGELKGADVASYTFPGPKEMGQATQPGAGDARLRRVPEGAGARRARAAAARSSSPTGRSRTPTR